MGKNKITLDELAELIGIECEGIVVYLGSCETMNWKKKRLQAFLEKTKALAILGFKKEVDWLRSASFDIQMLGNFLVDKFDSKGIEKIHRKIQDNCKSLIKELDFRMEINERIWFPRKRIKK
ncbi:MAG: hypothetical protein KBG11_07170 [Bacteroidia bacterium]|nr:hypothetical protein [Bacteroidia bacterium]